jgi:hypothetical protein
MLQDHCKNHSKENLAYSLLSAIRGTIGLPQGKANLRRYWHGTGVPAQHKVKKKNQAIILKLDLKKAYDCINWDFLRLILLQCGFGLETTNWVMGCVTSTVYAILINGEETKFFQRKRGLRQGCPLSPFLFILVMEGLSIMLKKGQAEGVLTGIKVSRIIKILHMSFVDDVIIMSKAKLSEWIEISKILNIFCRASGLRINVQKSTFLHSGVSRKLLTS